MLRCDSGRTRSTISSGDDESAIRLRGRPGPIIASALGIGLVNSAGNSNTLAASAAFRNEPYAIAIQQ
jgi:hypothetical protein